MKGRLRNARFSLLIFFSMVGASYGLLTARMPALAAQAGVDDAIVGMAMLSMGAGSLLGFAGVGLLSRYWSDNILLRACSFCLLFCLCLCGMAGSGATLCAAFAIFGLAFGTSDVMMNTQGIRLEKTLRHNCLSGLHGAYSLGALGGSVVAAICAALSFAPLLTFSIGGGLLLSGWAWAGRHLLPELQKSAIQKSAQKEKSGIPLIIIVYGLLCLSAFVVEGACGEWSALFLFSVKGADQSVAALGFGAMAVAITASRLMGDSLRSRIGDFFMLTGGALLALAGQAVSLYSPWPLLCLAGYAITGFGIAPVMPILLSRSGKRADISPQRATTVISIIGYSGLLVIPPSIGWLSRGFGLQTALLLPICFNLLIITCLPLFRSTAENKC